MKFYLQSKRTYLMCKMFCLAEKKLMYLGFAQMLHKKLMYLGFAQMLHEKYSKTKELRFCQQIATVKRLQWS